MTDDNEKEPVWPIAYVYAGFNLIVQTARVVIFLAAAWVALKPGGSVLAAILMLIIGSAIRTKSYAEDFERHG
ncbi:hypothetical protein NAV33_07455 [Pseudomonas stutzeri]|uniref:hypothetical protein n=1 Tax=Stutzerimonas stutzeri TaxID=316 RepID=UPI00210D6773|nr:hypothetical protein [Stutzerimonas stutzeri]MCQ4311731.1 hypothetical protein [Stutzerimonas stutzeri]